MSPKRSVVVSSAILYIFLLHDGYNPCYVLPPYGRICAYIYAIINKKEETTLTIFFLIHFFNNDGIDSKAASASAARPRKSSLTYLVGRQGKPASNSEEVSPNRVTCSNAKTLQRTAGNPTLGRDPVDDFNALSIRPGIYIGNVGTN